MKLQEPIIKICCIQDKYEAELAVHYGATALGLVSEMPSGPGVIPMERIKKLAEFIPESTLSVLLTSSRDSRNIIKQIHFSGVNAVQIVDRLVTGSYTDIRKNCPGIAIIQVIHVVDESSINEARKISNNVNAILLDSGNQTLSTRELGGTGRVHDWSISKRLCESVRVPVILAGGLNPDNVTEALKTVRPACVDICSGIRTESSLNEEKLAQYIKNVEAYFI